MLQISTCNYTAENACKTPEIRDETELRSRVHSGYYCRRYFLIRRAAIKQRQHRQKSRDMDLANNLVDVVCGLVHAGWSIVDHISVSMRRSLPSLVITVVCFAGISRPLDIIGLGKLQFLSTLNDVFGLNFYP